MEQERKDQKERKKRSVLIPLSIVVGIVLACAIFPLGGVAMLYVTMDTEQQSGPLPARVWKEQVIFGSGTSRVLVIHVTGVIGMGSDASFLSDQLSHSELLSQIRQASKDPLIKAVVLRVDSPGGGVVASNEIYNALQKLRDEGKNLVVSMGTVAASGGYYISTPADSIFANPDTLTGSLGVIISSLNYEETFDKVGLRQVIYKSGEFKDILSPARDATPEEQEILQTYVDEAYYGFVDVIVEGRNLPREEVLELADGRIYSGRQALEAISRAREQVSTRLGTSPRQVVFTSGGTEANNSAIRSALQLTGKKHLVTTVVEHSAVKNFLDQLEREGISVSRIPVDGDGHLDLDFFKRAVREDTALVSVMWANNETGVIHPVREIGEFCRQKGVLFHTDAVQALGKLDICLDDFPVDYAAFSAHKIYGPKGIRAVYVNRRVGFAPSLIGGGQESGRRGGTENVPAIVGFGAACEGADSGSMKSVRVLRDRFEAEVTARFPGAYVNGGAAERLPNTSNICFPDQDAEAILIQLDRDQICASTGSACATGSLEPSHVLLAMGRKRKDATASIRFSFGPGNGSSQLDLVLAALERVLKQGCRG